MVASTENKPALGVLDVFLAFVVEAFRVKGIWVLVAVEGCTPEERMSKRASKRSEGSGWERRVKRRGESRMVGMRWRRLLRWLIFQSSIGREREKMRDRKRVGERGRGRRLPDGRQDNRSLLHGISTLLIVNLPVLDGDVWHHRCGWAVAKDFLHYLFAHG